MSDNLNLFNIMEGAPPEKTREIVEFLTDYGRRKEFKQNEFVMKEGDESESIFIILEGIVEVIKQDGMGSEVVLTELGKGAIMGEMGIFLEKKRSATVRAKTDVVTSKFTNYSFFPALSKHPELLYRVLKSLAKKTDSVNSKLATAIDTKIMLVLSLYIVDQWHQTEKDLQSKQVNMELNIPDIVNDTRLEESQIFSAINTFKNKGVFMQLGTNGDKVISFKLDYRKFREFLKTICSSQ